MPQGSHKSDYMILAALGLLTVAVIGVFVAWGWLSADQEDSGIPTSHSTAPGGSMGCYLLLDKLGLPLARNERLLTEEELAGLDVLMLLEPVVAVGVGELSALRQWVDSGGVLICTADACQPLHRMSTGGYAWRSGRVDQEEFRDYAVRERLKSDSRRELPLQRDVSGVEFETAQDLWAGGAETRPRGEGPAKTAAGPVERLLADGEGVRIACRPLGAGRVIVLADSSFLTNRLLGRADNSVLAANLVAYAAAAARAGSPTSGRGKRMAFDEYHFGYGTRETGWSLLTRELFRSAPGWAVLVLTAAGVLYLVYRGRRFGTRRAPPRAARRSKLEYVQSVAATCRAAGANGLAFGLILTWFRRRYAELTHLPPSAGTEELAGAMARRTGAPEPGIRAVLDDCAQALRLHRLPARRMSALADELARLETEMTDGHRQRQ